MRGEGREGGREGEEPVSALVPGDTVSHALCHVTSVCSGMCWGLNCLPAPTTTASEPSARWSC